MGILRLILAVAVVIAHCSHLYGSQLYGFVFTGGVISVQAFYMISGFYMALILSGKYAGRSGHRLFYSNRFLRIFPAYWLVLILTVALSFAPGFTHIFDFSVYDYLKDASLLSAGTKAYLALSNIVLFGQDAVLFQGLDDAGRVYFTANYLDSANKLFTFMPLPQAWTLSLELTFYLLAPFLAGRKTFTLVGLVLLSLLLRGYIYFVAGHYHDPWTYRFFPTELAFFIGGMVSYRLYRKINEKSADKMIPLFAAASIMLITIGFQFIPVHIAIKQWLYYALIFSCMPLLFIFSRRISRLDRALGELSYPVYISHIFIMLLFSPVSDRLLESGHITLVICAATIIFSVLMMRYVLAPIERYRQKRVADSAVKHLPTVAMES